MVVEHLDVVDPGGIQPVGAVLGVQQQRHTLLGQKAAARLGQRGRQPVIAHRFQDEVHGIHRVTLDGKLGHVGDENQHQVPVFLPQLTGHRHAVEPRHLDVQQHNVKNAGVLAQKRSRVPELGNLEALAVFPLKPVQQFFQQGTLFLLVVHHRNVKHAASLLLPE